ncbi:MAG: hypothetical protein ACUZ77_09520 [Candidatus Brocadiales bacterium]
MDWPRITFKRWCAVFICRLAPGPPKANSTHKIVINTVASNCLMVFLLMTKIIMNQIELSAKLNSSVEKIYYPSLNGLTSGGLMFVEIHDDKQRFIDIHNGLSWHIRR